jgi:toxin ParE1/3/4
MKVVYTASALADLSEILGYLQRNYPTVIPSFESGYVVWSRELAIGPKVRRPSPNARECGERRSFDILTKVFYRVTGQTVEILHIYHTSRRGPWEKDTEHADLDNGDD